MGVAPQQAMLRITAISQDVPTNNITLKSEHMDAKSFK